VFSYNHRTCFRTTARATYGDVSTLGVVVRAQDGKRRAWVPRVHVTMAVTLVRETEMEGSFKERFLLLCGAGSLNAHD